MKHNKNDQNPSIFPDVIKDDLNDEFFEGLVSMAYHLNIDGPKLAERLAYEYMKYICENVDTSNAFIRSHTGYKRSTVENFKIKYKNSKLVPPKKESNIFNEFIYKLSIKCNKSINGSLPIKGDNSCHSIFESCNFSKNNTFTVKSVLSTLEKSGFIEVHKDHVVYTTSINEKDQRTKTDINRQFSNLVKDMSATQIHNMHEDEKNNRYFMRRASSVDVPDHLVPLTAHQAKLILSNAHQQFFDRLEVNEKISDDLSEHYQKDYQVSIHQLFTVTKRGKK